MASTRAESGLSHQQERNLRCLPLAVFALIASFTILPTAHGQAYMPSTLTEAIDDALTLTQFKQYAMAAGYGMEFDNPDFSGTVFAPVDAAWTTPDVMALTNATNATAAGNATNSTLSNIVAFHIVPGVKIYPISSLKQGQKLMTNEGQPIIVDLTVPGLVHLYGNDPVKEPTNFATVLPPFQEIKGNKAILYVIDRVLMPPKA